MYCESLVADTDLTRDDATLEATIRILRERLDQLNAKKKGTGPLKSNFELSVGDRPSNDR